MLNVEQFRYGFDNFGYLIHGKKEAVAIDGGAVEDILTFLVSHDLRLNLVTNTHDHPDHTAGNDALVHPTKARFLHHQDIPDGGAVGLEEEQIRVYHTPGHTADSVCFHTCNFLVSGDTLFNGTIGNCFSGDLRAFYRSIRKLMALPEGTIVYAGHDYVRDAMAFAKRLEPLNRDIDRFLESYDPQHVCSTLREELLINPYLRFDNPEIIGMFKKNGLPCGTAWERWEAVMSLE